jgi:predicted aspartyl protease
MNRTFFTSIVIAVIVLVFSGCTTFKAISVMNGGRPTSDIPLSEISFKTKGEHIIIVPVKINNSAKQYNFMLDTGALTLVSKKTAEELNLPSGVEIVAKDSVGATKPMQLTNLDLLRLGKMTVAECPTGILDFTEFGGNLKDPEGMDIDGVIGSNFLRYFKVTIDYKNQKMYLSNDTRKIPAKDGTYRIEFTTDMKNGYAPRIQCTIDNNIKVKAIIDTGAPYIATLPFSLVEKTDAYKKGQVVHSKGNIWGAAFKASENNQLLRLKYFQIGTLKLNYIPVISLPSNDILVGKKFLSKFMVTLNYPAKEMILVPHDTLDFPTNIFSFGTIVRKTKDRRTLVAGFWEGSAADKLGIDIGDELVMINGKKIGELSPTEVDNIYYNNEIREIDVVYKNKTGLHKTKATKEMLLPPL